MAYPCFAPDFMGGGVVPPLDPAYATCFRDDDPYDQLEVGAAAVVLLGACALDGPGGRLEVGACPPSCWPQRDGAGGCLGPALALLLT